MKKPTISVIIACFLIVPGVVASDGVATRTNESTDVEAGVSDDASDLLNRVPDDLPEDVPLAVGEQPPTPDLCDDNRLGKDDQFNEIASARRTSDGAAVILPALESDLVGTVLEGVPTSRQDAEILPMLLEGVLYHHWAVWECIDYDGINDKGFFWYQHTVGFDDYADVYYHVDQDDLHRDNEKGREMYACGGSCKHIRSTALFMAKLKAKIHPDGYESLDATGVLETPGKKVTFEGELKAQKIGYVQWAQDFTGCALDAGVQGLACIKTHAETTNPLQQVDETLDGAA